jgi:hypothetical protein
MYFDIGNYAFAIAKAEDAFNEAVAAITSGATEDEIETMSDLTNTLRSLEKQLAES